MKKTLSKPTYGIPDYSYDDPFVSTLKLKERTCKKLLRPTWSYPEIVSPVDYQQQFKELPDLDFDEFKEKFLGNGALEDELKCHFTPVLPEPEIDQMEQYQFTDNWNFKPEVVQAKDLQVLKPEPWSTPIVEENITIKNDWLEEIRQIPVLPLPFDDPLVVKPCPLLPGIPSENITPEVPLAATNLKMSFEEFSYPETPSCDYFVEFLASQIGDLSIVQHSEAKNELFTQPNVEGEKQHQRVSSQPEKEDSPNPNSSYFPHLSPKESVEVNARNESTANHSDQGSIENITLQLPSFALNVVRLMEDHLSSCLGNILKFDLSLITDLLKTHKTLAELTPNITRSCLGILKEEISAVLKDPRRKEYAKRLEAVLPNLLSLHGVNKALEIFLHTDYDLAYETLADFQKTHEKVLGSSYKMLLLKLLRFLPGNRDELHPKLTELRAIVLQHIGENKSGRTIWIRLCRYTNEVASRVHDLLATAGLFLPSGNSPVIIAEVLPENFPPCMLSLIIHYDQSSSLSLEPASRYAFVAQKVLEITRPVRVEELQLPNAEPETCPTLSSSPDAMPTSFSPLLAEDAKSGDGCMSDVSDNKLPDVSSSPTVEENAFVVSRVNPDYQDEARIESNGFSPEKSIVESCAESQLIDEEEIPLPTEEVCNETINTDNANIVDPFLGLETAPSLPDGSEDAEVPIVVSSHFENNVQLKEALIAVGDVTIHYCNYEFLGSHAKYQPHILLDAETAVLLIHENDDIKEMRLKIVSASIKCTRCLILLLAPSVTSSSKLPGHWFLLASLSKFYEMKTCRQGETRFELKSRLILNYHQVAFIVKDIAEENPDSNIRAHLYPLEGEAQLMLRYPQFNAVSASLIAEHFSLKELLTLPIDTLCDRIPSLEERIKLFRYCQESENEQQVARDDVGNDSYFGKLKPVWRLATENREQCVSLQSPTPNKRVKLDSQCQEELDGPLSASQLQKMWSSPNSSS